jgi:hypothetical protein
MSNVIPLPPPPESATGGPDDPSRQKIADAIKLLLSTLSPDDQERVLDEITQVLRPIPAPRAGAVLGAVVQLLPRRTEWTVQDLKQEIAARGVDATPKEVYNSLGYLTRQKRIRRVGYGRYLVDDGLLITADDLGLEPARDEDD